MCFNNVTFMSGLQSVTSKSVASASPGNLLELQSLETHLRSTESKTLCGAPKIVLANLPACFEVY